ncbi:MAG: tetratricopeptide repeat protein [Treponema sp.]|nr:tetratricopeptide repeat protein [Treponema sp.]
MNITCERPYALFGLLFVIPLIVSLFFKIKNLNYNFSKNSLWQRKKKGSFRFINYKKMIVIRAIFHSLAWCMLVLAYSKLYWGTYLMPVQKSGCAVSMVFDISNSMLAKDCPGSLPNEKTRLEASCIYAHKLLEKLKENGVPVSVVLAKGEGITAIPITEDYEMVESLLDVMSPSLMTAPGTSLGKGLLRAKNSFPTNYSFAGRVWLFTDGEETDGHLKNAIIDCVKAGIPVSIIGFGSEDESEVLAGDGKTLIKTALRSDRILNTISEAEKGLDFYKNQISVSYINSNEKGSAFKLLAQTKNDNGQIISYESKPVPRYKFFLIMAIFFFSFSYIFTEFDFNRFFGESKSVKRGSFISLVVVLLLLSGCSNNTVDILKGSYSFSRKQYRHAVSYFVDVVDSSRYDADSTVYDYALYDLGTAYLMLNEESASMEKFGLISDKAPDNVRFGAFYNAGVVAHKKGDYEAALQFFRKALEIDSSKIEAKINFELSLQQVEENVNQAESKAIPASEESVAEPELEKSIFERIREKDQQQWKNSESTQTSDLAEDY